MCGIWQIVNDFFTVYKLILIVYAVLSYLPSLRGRWTEYLARLVEPVLEPLRRIIPPLGGFDLSFIVLLILIQVVQAKLVAPQLFGACYVQ